MGFFIQSCSHMKEISVPPDLRTSSWRPKFRHSDEIGHLSPNYTVDVSPQPDATATENHLSGRKYSEFIVVSNINYLQRSLLGDSNAASPLTDIVPAFCSSAVPKIFFSRIVEGAAPHFAAGVDTFRTLAPQPVLNFFYVSQPLPICLITFNLGSMHMVTVRTHIAESSIQFSFRSNRVTSYSYEYPSSVREILKFGFCRQCYYLSRIFRILTVMGLACNVV